jgi:hypothetical protein
MIFKKLASIIHSKASRRAKRRGDDYVTAIRNLRSSGLVIDSVQLDYDLEQGLGFTIKCKDKKKS